MRKPQTLEQHWRLEPQKFWPTESVNPPLHNARECFAVTVTDDHSLFAWSAGLGSIVVLRNKATPDNEDTHLRAHVNVEDRVWSLEFLTADSSYILLASLANGGVATILLDRDNDEADPVLYMERRGDKTFALRCLATQPQPEGQVSLTQRNVVGCTREGTLSLCKVTPDLRLKEYFKFNMTEKNWPDVGRVTDRWLYECRFSSSRPLLAVVSNGVFIINTSKPDMKDWSAGGAALSQSPVYCVDFAQCGSVLATGSADEICTWNVDPLQKLQSITRTSVVRSVRFTLAGGILAASDDSTVRHFSAQGEYQAKLRGALTICSHRRGACLVGCRDGSLSSFAVEVPRLADLARTVCLANYSVVCEKLAPSIAAFLRYTF